VPIDEEIEAIISIVEGLFLINIQDSTPRHLGPKKIGATPETQCEVHEEVGFP
jgi:hypothetical protein